MRTAALGATNTPIRAEVHGTVADGFARLALTMAEETPVEVRLAGTVMILSFKRPVDLSVDRLPVEAAGYVGAVRRDPDGTAVRIALARKVSVNTLSAGERLFVDLLPDTWTGRPPGLPQDVVEELARRARDAERKLRERDELARRRRPAEVRVRVARLPTLTRYIFEISDAVPVSSERNKDDLALTFGAPIKFDLADASAALPPDVGAVAAETKDESTIVRLRLLGKAEPRSFREDGAFVLDVARPKAAAENAAASKGEVPPAATTARKAAAPAPAREAEGKPFASPGHAAGDAVGAQGSATSERKPAREPEAAQAPPQPGDDKPALAPSSAKADAPKEGASGHGAPPQPKASRESAAEARESEPAPARKGEPSGNGTVSASLKRDGTGLRLAFPFREATAAAAFVRADTLWIVFDGAAPLDLAKLRGEASRTIRDVSVSAGGDGSQVVRIKLNRPVLASMSAQGPAWTVALGDTPAGASAPPLAIARTRTEKGDAGAVVSLPGAGKLHRLSDPDIGDRLFVVTAAAPVRALPKTQDFVDFRALASAQGVAVAALADDLTVVVARNNVAIERPGGLTLSAAASAAPTGTGLFRYQAPAFDTQVWGFDRQADGRERESALMAKAAEAPDGSRTAARLDLARFYLARDRLAEAKGVLDVVLSSERDKDLAAVATVLRGTANLLGGREEEALKDFANPVLSKQHEAPLWRALSLARMGRFGDAEEGLKQAEAASAGLPLELQRFALTVAARASLETGDLAEAARRLRTLDGLGVSREEAPAVAVLSGRVAEGFGRFTEASEFYRTAAASSDQASAAQGRLREVALQYAQKRIPRAEAVAALERLSAAWRGDETELETLQRLARFYTEDGRFRDAFHLMRVALSAQPRSEITRRIQDEAGATFESVFLGDRGNALSPVEALGLFYDFRSLTPPGRRGDEMIRRLAERLVSMDLLAQAGELLQHQVDRRLQGVARAQVAARLATVYLMDRKPARALKALLDTRVAEIPNDLRKQRLLLEARALSDTGRPALALEVIANMDGREVERLRADVLWSASRWGEAAEQIERLYGERWKNFAPLDASERADVMRAAVSYALAGDAIGLERFRERYAPKMADGPERRMFDVVTSPFRARGDEFRAIAKAASSFDTLNAFLRDMRERFPPAGTGTSASADEPRG